MSNLHNQIMNIEMDNPIYNNLTEGERQIYKLGHRDARHVAAELSNETMDYIEELEDAAREALKEMEDTEIIEGVPSTAAMRLRNIIKKSTQYVIRNGDAERYNDVEYWNNNMGWVEDRENASTFIQNERDNFDLPMNGYWERV